MKRFLLALLLTGPALAGSTVPVSEIAHGTSFWNGKFFDLTWVNQMTLAQTKLDGLDELEARYGQRPALKRWAERDAKARQETMWQLQDLKNQIKAQGGKTVPVFIGDADGADRQRFDPAFFAHYLDASAQISTLAHLALSKSQNPAVRREAQALLRTETARLNELKGFK